MSDTDFVSRMITDCRVAVVPGSAFGPESGSFVRVSLAASDHDLRTGITRLAEAVGAWGAGR
jgi:aspartate/methionine/tyrosine aminotransferase